MQKEMHNHLFPESPADLTAAKTANTHFALLDGLRGIAAIAVLFLHIFHSLKRDDIFPHAYLAVDFFFLLSGFVVAKAYEVKLKTVLTFMDFLKIRLIRLYPMILIGVLMGATALGIHLSQLSVSKDSFITAVFCNLFLLPTHALTEIYQNVIYPIDLPEWSLFFEIAINCVYALIVSRLSTKILLIIVIFSDIALLAVASYHQSLDVGANADTFPLGFVRVTFPFFLGVLLFRYRPLYRLGMTSCLLLTALVTGILFTPFASGNWAYDAVSSLLLFPFIVFLGSISVTTRILHRICLGLGELSYPLYITHQPLVRIVMNGLQILHLQFPAFIIVALCAAVALIIAAGLLILWDRPARKWLSAKLLPRRRLPSFSTQTLKPIAR